MPHLPGLDGLRGLAVVGVLLFHGGFGWARGGFLGVSTFFTLSGFLITNILVREWDSSSAIRLSRFWVRRFRRLLPAALITIALVGLVWWRIGSPEQLDGLRADMFGALGYAANWRFLTAGTSYADLFSAPSPLQHFWSLAIEEQFYVVFPLVVLGLMRLGGRRLLTIVLVVTTIASVGLEIALGGNVDRVYYGTDTRSAELLLGALLAVWWSGRTTVPRGRYAHSDGTTATWVADAAGLVALVGVLWAWTTFDQTSGQLARGGFPVYALATVTIIYAATRPGLVARLLSIPALRWAGLVSYGLYLYHWPIFLWLDEERTGLSVAPLFVVRMAVTTVVAVASYFLVEMPVRRGTMVKTGRAALSAGLAGAVVVGALAVAVTLDPPRSTVPYGDVKLSDEFATTQVTADPNAVAVAPVSATIPRSVLILGDSGTVDASPAILAAFAVPGPTSVKSAARPGVGLTTPGFDWRQSYAQLVADNNPDLVIMMIGGWDYDFYDEEGPDAYATVVDEAVDVLSAGGAHVLWLSMLPGGTTADRKVDTVFERLPDRHPGVVSYADIETSLRAPAGATDLDALDGAELWPRSYVAADGTTVVLRKKSDSWHLCPPGAERIAAAVNRAAADAGLATIAPDGWQVGVWRNSPYYNDPTGTCDL